MPERKAWILAGATATGKTAAAQILAERRGLPILSADSMLVYRGLDIGTAKPPPEERGAVAYFGMDLADPDEPFSTGAWLEAARRAADAAAPGPLIAAGGTGLYLKALTEGLDGRPAPAGIREQWRRFFQEKGAEALRRELSGRWPEAAGRLADAENPRRLLRAAEQLDAFGKLPDGWAAGSRPPPPPFPVLRMDRGLLRERIARRVDQMFDRGWVEEVRALRARFPVWSETARKAIGYAEVLALLDGDLSLPEAKEKIAARTRRLAKRQETWFRHQARAVCIDVRPGDSPGTVAGRVEEIWREHGPADILPD